MPPIKDKNKKTIAKAPEREVIYPEVHVSICCGDDAVTAEQAKKLLGWESEDEYAARVGDQPGAVKFGDALLKDEYGKKVQCWNNTTNRPYSEPWSRGLAQDILTRNWKFNLETIVISRTGLVTSGQHRLIGLVLACQMWNKNQAAWENHWATEPTIDVLVAFGGSEDQSVLNTVDNVKPRTLSDVFYTSQTFAKLGSTERKECSRMMDAAIDLMWRRTGFGGKDSANKSIATYQTHSASVEFLNRHPKIKDAVKHIFEENVERQISGLKLSPGQCAAMMYMMAACETDGDTYRNGKPPSEDLAQLDERWDEAAEFWALLGADAPTVRAAREVLAKIVDMEGGRTMEKQAVIAKAWNAFKGLPKGKNLSEDVLELTYGEHPIKKTMVLTEDNDDVSFGGIDVGFDFDFDPDDVPDEKQVEEDKAAERRKRAEELNEKIKAKREADAKKKAPTLAENLTKLKADLPEPRVVALKSRVGVIATIGEDADLIVSLCKVSSTKVEGMTKVVLAPQILQEVAEKLAAEGHILAIAEECIVGPNNEKEVQVKDVIDAPPASKPTVKPKKPTVAKKK